MIISSLWVDFFIYFLNPQNAKNDAHRDRRKNPIIPHDNAMTGSE